MILYLDTSALVKLFVDETGSQRMKRAVSRAQLITTHAIAYVEACAAFARLAYGNRDERLFSDLCRHLDVQWNAWEIMSANESLIRRAADFAGRYRLRGYDSVHLAAAESAFDTFRAQVPFCFGVFDHELRSAAAEAGIPLIDA